MALSSRKSRLARPSIALLALLASLPSCKSEGDQRQEAAQQAAVAKADLEHQQATREADQRQALVLAKADLERQEVAREADQRKQVLETPDAFLGTSDLGYHDKGIINDYRTLTNITVLNKSKYALDNLQGDVDWLDAKGAKVGSMPLSLKGSIPAGDTKTFSTAGGTLTNGTLQASGTPHAHFSHVEIVGAK